ncbi:MAG: EF-hand domain-containing protein [Planctomycetes bacterium]|nr:EF-hand domain-containing protein [Planctomycetota bacterium]MCW8137222.1 EF-hand domain-containing protein [Planctomycetota bacterium]
MNNLREMFDRALRDELAPREQADFDAAMRDPAMARAFEAYSDARADTGSIDAWLRDAAQASRAAVTLAPSQLAMRAQPRRGHLIRLAAAIGTVAAAAAIIAIIFVQPGRDAAPETAAPTLAGEGDRKPDDKKPEKPIDEPKPDDKPKPLPPEFTRMDINGDGKLDRDEIPPFMLEQMDDNKDGAVDADEFRKHHKPPVPPKPEEVFKKLDRNSDGVLDDVEIDERMRRDFDEDGSGDVSLAEFRKFFKPKPPKPEEEFERLDRDKDGFLKKDEIPTRMVRDMDDNGDGRVSLDEFRKHFKPPQPQGDGPRPPRPPEGDGPRPPRPPEGDGPRPPRPPEGDGPRPPRPPRD